jgi:transposase
MKGGCAAGAYLKQLWNKCYMCCNRLHHRLVRISSRFRLYPTTDQEQIFAHNFGQARFLVNFFLAERKAFYEAHKTEKKKGLNYNDNANALKSMKKDPECLAENRAFTGAIQQFLKDLDKATQNFFAKACQVSKVPQEIRQAVCSLVAGRVYR